MPAPSERVHRQGTRDHANCRDGVAASLAREAICQAVEPKRLLGKLNLEIPEFVEPFDDGIEV